MEDVILVGPGRDPTVVHCVKADRPSTGSPLQSTHTDWLDSVDSGSALCWIALVLLAVCWSFYCLSGGESMHAAFNILAGMSTAVFMGLFWPCIGPVLDLFCHWWVQYMECRPCLPGEVGLYADGMRRRQYVPPRPPAPGVSRMHVSQQQSMSPLYHF